MLLDYIPARLVEGKSWCITYYIEHPVTKTLTRKRIRVTCVKNIKERRKFARQLVQKINLKLADGWNPFIEQEAPNAFHKLSDAIKTYLSVKERELRKDSLRSYQSISSSLLKWINNKDLTVIEFTKQHATKYLTYLYIQREVSEVVYNNHRNFGRLLFNWLIENQYCKANPFLQIKTKKERTKTRIPINSRYRQEIKRFLELSCEYEFLAICMLTYYTLIRPSEICQLKRHMFDFKRHIITLPGEICKDGDERIVTMPDSLIYYLEKLNIQLINDSYYIFSDKFKPGKIKKDSRYIAKRWERLRNQIKMPKEMQFYSLKDTGIINMIREGVSLLKVRDQAGHSSLEVTNKYAKIANIGADDEILTKKFDF